MKKDLRDGLVLRSLSEGVQSDADNVAQFFVDVFAEDGDDDAPTLLPWIGDLMRDDHPNMSLDYIWVVVDPAKEDQIVSSLMLIPQAWHYDDIVLSVGRVELVATHKDYRRRGLVREQMDVAHQLSTQLGHHLQSITGIDHYYRRFGYAMAVDLGTQMQMPVTSIPALKADQEAKFTLRPAQTDDIASIFAWEAYDRRNGGIMLDHTHDNWHFDLNVRHAETPHSNQVCIIVDADGQSVGFVSFFLSQYYRNIDVLQFVVGDQSSYFEVYNDVLRGIKSVADPYYATLPDDKYPINLRFASGFDPAIKSLVRKSRNGLIHKNVYAWYIRIDDIPAFIKHIAPVLEHRLVGSGMNRFTGEVKIGFFALNGIKITFDNGQITDVVDVELKQFEADAAFPYDTFLNVVFGHRDWREMAYVLPEVHANQKADLLLSILFPKMRAQLLDGIA